MAVLTSLAVVIASFVSAPSVRAATPASTAAATGQAVEITLITGDKVRYEAGPDGKQQVTVVEAVSTAFRGEKPPEGGLYLFPDIAEPYVASGVLDRELFNIEYLATHGYDDAHMQRLPLIVDYAGDGPAAATRARGSAAGLAASRTGPVLESIGAAGLSVDKAHADRFWESLAPQPATKGPGLRAAGELSPAVDKVWLDRKVSVTLNESVPMIGAPEAWDAGFDGTGVTVAVLDTGIDATHPDLAGTVVASKSFVSDSVNDGHGHGTHVASTIVGTGAASEGQHRGVAPGADLVVGKVLNDEGSGSFAQIIDGMEWAAQEQDADIISMSLGCGPDDGCVSDGTDPASMAVNSLTASTGALFVISAGNDGSDLGTVGLPGVADAALTVAASNEGDIVWPIPRFSSRGPRVDGVLKPDIAAPGVHITAARAAGTSLCEIGCLQPEDGPVDDFYTNASGTSMAAPHIAGAAAILAQQHPGWTAEQLKITLMSTSLGLKELLTRDVSAYAQGAGRVDIARAVSQQLRTDTANISPGILERDEPAYVVPVTYTNDSASDLTVSVEAVLRMGSGHRQPAAEGTISLDQDTLTVPAGGSATLTVTLDASATTEFGAYEGVLTAATAAGDTLRTPIGVTIQPPLNDLTVRLVKPAPVSELPYFDHGFGLTWGAMRVDDQEEPWFSPRISWRDTDDPQVVEATMPVPDGIYMVFGTPNWVHGHLRHRATIIEPDVTVDGDTVITIDMRDLVPVTASADQPTEEAWRVYAFNLTSEAGRSFESWHITGFPKGYQHWAYPTEPVRTGQLWLREGFILAEPELLLELRADGRRLMLHPLYPDFPADSENRLPKLTRDTKTVLVTEADLEAGRDVHGALVLVHVPETAEAVEPCPTGPWRNLQCTMVNHVQQAAEAGAAGVLLTTPEGSGLPTHLSFEPYASMLPVPLAWLDPQQADRLAGLLESGKPVDARIDAAVDPSYKYKVWFRESGQVPADMTYELDPRDLKRIDAAYHGPESTAPEFSNAYETMHAFWPGDHISFAAVRWFDAPTQAAEYYLPTGPEVVHTLAHSWNLDSPVPDITTRHGNNWRTIVGTEPETIDWGTVATPGQDRLGGITRDDVPWAQCTVCRQGDHLWVFLIPTMGDGGHHWNTTAYDASARLFDADGTEIPGVTPWQFTLPPEAGRYRLEHVQTDRFTDTLYGRQVRTVWDFTATAKPTVNEVNFPYNKPRFNDPDPAAWQPVIFLNYEIPLALDNTAVAGQPVWITVHAAAGEPGSGADIAGLELQASFDDGETWAESLVVRPVGDGTFQVLIKHPKLSETTGAVTLRTEAWDEAGNRVTQTIDRAYGLR